MISFESDYVEGAHPLILQQLEKTNLEQLSGYGADPYSERAREKIRAACGCPEADVFFLSGGTQTNQIVISSLLAPCEGVLSADTGHISTHEAGAIEASGHKVLLLPQEHGKLSAKAVSDALERFYGDGNHDHMVFPGMVYLSYPTEFGTLYSRDELAEIHRVCQSYRIPLFVDGARLGYGLMSDESDLTLPGLASLCDVFYIGGTKVGALLGEAVVFSGRKAPAHFMTIIKQRGALLAKGRLLGIQFDALFTEDLYFQISRHAVEAAMELRDIFLEKGYRFYLESPTNQQFVILENRRMEQLRQQVAFSYWDALDENHTIVRFATSWATTRQQLDTLRSILPQA